MRRKQMSGARRIAMYVCGQREDLCYDSQNAEIVFFLIRGLPRNVQSEVRRVGVSLCDVAAGLGCAGFLQVRFGV